MTDIALQNDTAGQPSAAAILSLLGSRSIVLVGMMGVGKPSIGRRLAARLGVPFVDADTEIEKAACMSIADIFVLMRRINKRKDDRPMLQTADPAATLRELLVAREPVYAQADLTVQSREVPHDAIVAEIMTVLAAFLNAPGSPRQGAGA